MIFLRKIQKKVVDGPTDVQIVDVSADISKLSRRIASAEEELLNDDPDQVTRDNRLTALEGKFDDQSDLVKDFLDAYNANQTKKVLTPRTNIVTATLSAVENGVIRNRTLYPLRNLHPTGDGWSIEFRHSTYTSGNWTTGDLPGVPQGTSIEVRAVQTGTNTLLDATTSPSFLGWSGALTGTNNQITLVMPASGTEVGANVTTTTGETVVYSVTGDQEVGAHTVGYFSGKVRVTVSGWVNTYGGSGAPVYDAFYQLSGWYSVPAKGDDKYDTSSFKYSKKPNKMVMQFLKRGETSGIRNIDWEYPLGNGSNAYDPQGYPTISWTGPGGTAISAPTSLSEQQAILGDVPRTKPSEGVNQYTFDLDLGARAGLTPTTQLKLGVRAWAREGTDGNGDPEFQGYGEGSGRYGTFWINIEPVEGEGTYSRT